MGQDALHEGAHAQLSGDGQGLVQEGRRLFVGTSTPPARPPPVRSSPSESGLMKVLRIQVAETISYCRRAGGGNGKVAGKRVEELTEEEPAAFPGGVGIDRREDGRYPDGQGKGSGK